MRKKYLTKTYLRDVESYKLDMFLDKEDCFVVVKKIIKVNSKFVVSDGLCLIDDGYYIVEVVPKKENYAMRIFFDRNKNLLQHYFDISLENGLDKDTLVPYYDDLYLDIIVQNNSVYVDDKDELDSALKENKISQKEYKLANDVCEKLLEELKNKTNKYFNMNFAGLLK